MKLPPKLIIFDCDGVLVDTEGLCNRELSKWLTEAGFPIGYEACRRRFNGRTMASVRDEVEASGVLLGRTATLNEALPALLAQGVDLIPHVRELVELVRGSGIAYCVASSARVTKMNITLGVTGMLPWFKDRMFSASMVARGKPFPDVFFTRPGRWALPHPTASSSRIALPARRLVWRLACPSIPMQEIQWRTAKAWRRRAAWCSMTCASSPICSISPLGKHFLPKRSSDSIAEV